MSNETNAFSLTSLEGALNAKFVPTGEVWDMDGLQEAILHIGSAELIMIDYRNKDSIVSKFHELASKHHMPINKEQRLHLTDNISEDEEYIDSEEPYDFLVEADFPTEMRFYTAKEPIDDAVALNVFIGGEPCYLISRKNITSFITDFTNLMREIAV